MSRIFAPFLTLLACSLAACGSGPQDNEEGDTPQPTPTRAAAPTQAADGTALTPGSWDVRENADGAMAAFGEDGGRAIVVLACDSETGAVTLTRAARASDSQPFLLQVGTLQARVDMTPTEEPLRGYSAEVDGSMPLFAAMGDPAETIRLSGADMPALTLPTNGGILRVLEACR